MSKKKIQLYNHQKEALRRVLYEPYVALFMEAGSGKTPVAIRAIRKRYMDGDIYKVWISVPKTLIENWESEIHKFIQLPKSRYTVETLMDNSKAKRVKAFDKFMSNDINNLSLDELHIKGFSGTKKDILANHNKQPKLMILLVNYEKARVMFKEIRKFRPEFLIIDESHNLKNRGAARSSKTHTLSRASKYRVLLSGTPICGGYEDLFMQYKIMMDFSPFSSSYKDFELRYVEKGGYMGYDIVGYKKIDEIKAILNDTSYRVLLDECIQLPERLSDLFMYIDLGAKGQKAYNELRKDFETSLEILSDELPRAELKERCRNLGIPYEPRESYEELFYKVSDFYNTSSCDMAITQRLRLQQMTGGFITMDSGEVINIDRGKIEAVADYVQSYRKPLLIFCQFLAEINELEKVIRDMKITTIDDNGRKIKVKNKVASFTGKTKNRNQVYKDFQDGKIDILILQVDTGGVGLNLQRASRAIMYSYRTYEKYYQAIGRIRRSGQKDPYQIIHIMARNTVDDVVLKSVKDMKVLIEKVMKH